MEIIARGQITIWNYKDGSDAYSVMVDHDTHAVACDQSGNALSGELGASGKAVFVLSAYKGSTKLVMRYSTATSATGICSWKIGTVSGCTAVQVSGSNEKFYINTMTADSGYVEIVCSIDGKVSVTKKITIVKQKKGATGSTGKQGCMLRPRGFWTAQTQYVYNDQYRDVVLYDNDFKIVKSTHTSGTTFDSTKWEDFNEFINVATSVLLANTGFIKVLGAGKVFIGQTDSGNGWEMTAGAIKHTKTALELTADGKLKAPSGLSIIAGSKTLNDYILDSKSEYAVSTSEIDPPTEGWSTTTPERTDNKYIWTRIITTYGSGKIETSEPVCLSGTNGKDGKGIKNTTITYQASTSGTSVPSGTWNSTIPSVAANQYLWTRTIITYTDNSTSTSYCVGKMGATGAKGDTGATGPAGADGDGIVSVTNTYQIGTSGTTAPTGTWSTFIPSPQKGKYLWTKTVTTYKKSGTTTTYSVSYYGTDGINASYITVSGEQIFKYTSNFAGTPTPSSIILTATLVGTSGYQWSYRQAGQTSFTNISGATSSTYTLAHNNSTVWGNSKSVTIRCTSGGKYDEITVAKVSDGAKGDKGDQGLQGEKGDKGESGAIAKQITVTDLNTMKSTTYEGRWYAGGSNSIANKPSGVDAFGLDVSRVASGWYSQILTSSNTSTNKMYIRYWNSSAWTAWVEKGKDGEQGIPGVAGSDGKTSYLHIAYANSSDGSSGFSTTDSANKLYIGQYTDFTQSDSTDYKKYSWSKIKGETGAKGDKGDKGDTGAAGKGIKSVVNHYLASTASSGVTTSTSGWTTTIQTITESKKYLWNYETITYTDNSSTSSSPCIIGVYGSKGATGSAGKGIKSITEYYAVSSSNTAEPTSWTTSLVNTTATNKYLWNYERITYTDNSTEDTTKRVIGTHGATGPTGPKGDTGAAGKDAYTVLLGNESHTFAGTTSAAIASSAKCTVLAYKGITQMAATIGTPTGMPTGMTHTISNNGTTSAYITFSVTASMTTSNGIVNIPITVDGKPFTKQFSYAISFKGSTGATGPTGAASVVYSIQPSATKIVKSITGALTPASLTCAKYKTIGNSTATVTTEKTLKYQRLGVDSAEMSYSGAVTITDETKSVVFSLYDGSTLLDRENVPILSDASDLELGGTNYAQGTINEVKVTSISNASNQTKSLGYKVTGLKKGDTITVSLDYEAYNINFASSSSIIIQFGGAYSYNQITTSQIKSNGINHIKRTFTLNNHYNSSDPVTEEDNGGPFIRFDYITFNSGGYFLVKNFMVNKGNVEVDWSPAPEDLGTKAELQVLDNKINSKVSQTDFNALKSTVSSHTTQITQNANNISLKADKTTVNDLSTTVSSHSSIIVSNTQGINSLTSKTNDLGKEVSSIKQLSDSISLEVYKLKLMNLFPGGDFESGLLINLDIANCNVDVYKTSLSRFGNNCLRLITTNSYNSWVYLANKQIVVKPNTKYTIVFWVKGSTSFNDANGATGAYWAKDENMGLASFQQFNLSYTTSWVKKRFVMTSPNESKYLMLRLGTRTGEVARTMYFDGFMVFEGDVSDENTNEFYQGENDGLLSTGINIKDKVIEVTSDQFKIKNNAGEVTASVNKEGVIETNGGIFNGSIRQPGVFLELALYETTGDGELIYKYRNKNNGKWPDSNKYDNIMFDSLIKYGTVVTNTTATFGNNGKVNNVQLPNGRTCLIDMGFVQNVRSEPDLDPICEWFYGDKMDIGRIVRLIHLPYSNAQYDDFYNLDSSYYLVIKAPTLESGNDAKLFRFYDGSISSGTIGRQNDKLVLHNEIVELFGYGVNDVFRGWIVMRRIKFST